MFLIQVFYPLLLFAVLVLGVGTLVGALFGVFGDVDEAGRAKH